jgi:hypothetical protein
MMIQHNKNKEEELTAEDLNAIKVIIILALGYPDIKEMSKTEAALQTQYIIKLTGCIRRW